MHRVQFERRELGVELVKDTDVMPVEPVLCLPPEILQASPKVSLDFACSSNRVYVQGQNNKRNIFGMNFGVGDKSR